MNARQTKVCGEKEQAVYRAQRIEDERARAAGEKPRLITTAEEARPVLALEADIASALEAVRTLAVEADWAAKRGDNVGALRTLERGYVLAHAERVLNLLHRAVAGTVAMPCLCGETHTLVADDGLERCSGCGMH